MSNNPIIMEDYFNPGFKTKPAVHVGSQTIRFFRGSPKEQAWEGFFLSGIFDNDVIVVRDLDQNYIKYWENLVEGVKIVNLVGLDKGKFLTEIILENPYIVDSIKRQMAYGSRLMVFHQSELEEKLANAFGISLHGSVRISELYGTKSGIRKLAKEFDLIMPRGFVCSTYFQVKKAISDLKDSFDNVIIKHDSSLSGYFSKKMAIDNIGNLREILDKISGGKFTEGKDIVVVEGWVKSKTVLGAHIEILGNKDPIICAGWQQIIDSDGISYMGAGPLMLSSKALKSFITQVNKLAKALKDKGAVGSYGPDYIVASEEETNIEPDTCALIELNSRIPYTAFPLEAVKNIKGKIGHGFLSRHIKLSKEITFLDIRAILEKERLLITKKDNRAKGVLPYNVGLLPWRLFDIVAIGDSAEEALWITKKVDNIFKKL